ncbi:hypothetical protein BDF21DRAFT_445885 [Thamnidium elegans]|nr:hypothetical protein BDF21DRAFT_445885 [Thamnidium elegans]
MSNQQRAEKVVKGGKNETFAQKNTVNSLLNRAIKFRKSRYVDQKLELFKKKFAPVNGTAGVVHATSAYDNISGSGGDTIVDKIDANGFENPSKVLFAKDKLNSGWNNIHPVGSGLKDLGHLSSLNAVLQVLTYTPALANYLLERKHSANCTIQDYCFVCAVEEHVRTALKGSPYALQPRVFVGKLKKMKNGSSKDAYDVWNYFMEQIQSFLISEKTTKDKLVAKTSALYQIFGGYIQTKLECASCNQPENTYDSFLSLSLDLTQCSSVERCLTKHFKEQVSAIKECVHCQNEGELTGKKSVYKTPMTIAIQLQRFNQDSDRTKINKTVKFEETIDISRIVTESEKENVNTKYNLYSIIVHTGDAIHNGRYMAYVKSSSGVWYCMDNENVQVASMKRLLEEKPYMLFYNTPPKVEKREKKKPVKKENKEIAVEPVVLEDIEQKQVVEEEEEEEKEEVMLPEVDEDEEEEKERLRKALEEASTKEKIDNTAAIVVDANENMKSKRDKLGALIEKESLQSKSSKVKEELLTKLANNQFEDEIGTWEEDIGSTVEKRKSVLKQFKQKRKRVDMYDLDYDRGKVKKIKNKQEEKFNKPNMFQITAEKTADRIKKNKGKRVGKT